MGLIDSEFLKANGYVVFQHQKEENGNEGVLPVKIDDIPTIKSFSVTDMKTGKEADPYVISVKERWARELIACDLEGFAITEDGLLILADECGNFVYCPTNRFEVKWKEGEA